MKGETVSFSLLEAALRRLDEALAENILSNPVALDASIQRFEFCFELFWKTVQHLLRAQEGIDAPSPRRALQEAYRLGWIDDETDWLTMLHDRNLTSHTYREPMALAVYQRIKEKHFPLLLRTTASLKQSS